MLGSRPIHLRALCALCGENLESNRNENLHSPGTLQHWVDRIRAGDVRALAPVISTIEDHHPESREVLKSLFNFSGRAQVIGLTGAPGAGKSTLVDQLARE